MRTFPLGNMTKTAVVATWIIIIKYLPSDFYNIYVLPTPHNTG